MGIEKKLEALFSAPAEKRYKNFITEFVNLEEAWGLHGQHWVMLGDKDEEKKCLALWPSSHCAKAQNDIWFQDITLVPNRIHLEEMIHDFIPNAKKSPKAAFAIFPVNGKGMIVSPDKLLNDIREEMKWYE